jgi:hypothetical protein
MDGDIIHINLAQEVSFLNKAAIKETLQNIPEQSYVIINASNTVYISHDILAMITEFATITSKELSIDVKLEGFKKEYNLENNEYFKNTITFEHRYNVLKRKVEIVRKKNN